MVQDTIRDILGLNIDALSILKFAVRAVLTFTVALIFVRLNGIRMFSKASAFDFVVSIMIGSILSRAITYSSPFLPTIAASAVLVFIHWLLGYLAFRHDWIGHLIKGSKICLVQEGELQWENMAQTQITERELLTAARTHAHVESLERIKDAFVERDGRISIITW